MKEILSVENMRKSDAATWKNIPAAELMYRAGRSVFDYGKWEYPAAIVCGGGNNAGDGYVIAELIKDARKDCTIFLTSERFSEDGRFYYERCLKKNVKVQMLNSTTDLSAYKTVFDCIFGTGFKGEPEGMYKTAIEKINESGAFVVSVDINSGLNGNNGLCVTCVDSDITISLGGLKSGLYLNMAKDHIKEIANADIGIVPVDKTYKLLEEETLAEVFTQRKNYSNKGTYGYVALIGGSEKYSGAAKLANMAAAALRSGSGVVRLAVPESLTAGVMPYILESTLCPMPENQGSIAFAPEAIDACLKGTKAAAIGMGTGTGSEVAKVLEYIMQTYEGVLIIDADGLNTLAKMNLEILREAACRVILTPHLKEFSRLTGLTIDEIQKDPIAAAKDYAAGNNCIVLLKGPATIVTDGDEVILTDRGCPGMATAGSGDVLSGILTAVCGYYGSDLLMAAGAAAYVNGAAGEAAQEENGAYGMIASDTVKMIPKIIKKICVIS